MPVEVPAPRVLPLPVVVPTLADAALPPDLDCPTPPVGDAPIGRPVADADLVWDHGERAGKVVASARAPALAILRDGAIRISDDDGRHFRPVRLGTAVDDVALDARGRLYAAAGNHLAVRSPDGRIRWTKATGDCVADAGCPGSLVASGDRVLWLHGSRTAVTADGARSWRRIADDDAAGFADAGRPGEGVLLGWDGSAYATEHVVDMCGIDDYDVATLDLATGTYHHDVFHAGDEGGPALVSRGAGPTWRYRVACDAYETGDAPDPTRPCPRAVRTRRALRALEVARLRPVVGGRVLFVDHGLAELCGDHARLVVHDFPFGHVDAVDAGGRPLIAFGGRLLRWSPRHGWRVLLDDEPPGDR